MLYIYYNFTATLVFGINYITQKRVVQQKDDDNRERMMIMNGCEEKETKYHERAEEYAKRIIEQYPVFEDQESVLTMYFASTLQLDEEGKGVLKRTTLDEMMEAPYKWMLINSLIVSAITGVKETLLLLRDIKKSENER